MWYKVYCYNGHKPNTFYCDNKDRANLLFNMAVESKMFEYVELAEVIEDCFMKREWSADDGRVD